jgi:hypothetical protein
VTATPASAAADHVVITGGATVPVGETTGDVVVIDGPVNIAGHVTGDLISVHGVVTVAGSVDGDVVAVSERAHLLPESRVGGDLVYGGPLPNREPGSRVEGQIRAEDWNDFATGLEWAVRLIVWAAVSVSTLLFGLVVLAFTPRAAESAWTIAQERTGLAAAWAAGLFFGIPAVAIILMITVFGLPLGLGLLLALIPLATLGYITSCWLLGQVITRNRTVGAAGVFVVGWVIARLVALIPYVGGLAWVVGSAFGLAVLLLAAWYASKPGRVVPVAPPPAGPPQPRPPPAPA